MKRTIKLLALAAAVAVFAVPVLAQADQCTDDNKAAWYKTFLDNYKGDETKQKVAYDAAKKYIGSCPSDQYSDYMQKKFVDPYDKLHQNQEVATQFQDAIKNSKYADQMRFGKQLLTSDPDNPDVNTILGIAGLADTSLLNESQQYARKAISLIEAGKPVKVFSKDQALAYLNWTIGKSKLTSAPADAIPDLLKAAKIESDVKKKPELYIDLAGAYETGPRAKLSTEYTASLNPDKTETAQSKVILENLNQVIDRQIDAMARAAALTPDAAKKQAIVTELTALYKYRNKADTGNGVTELLATVLSKPIPEVPVPITSMPAPAPTPSSTPATTNGGSNGGANNGGAKQTGNNMTSNTSNTGASKTGTATGTATQTGTAKPVSSPSPTRKPPMKFHN